MALLIEQSAYLIIAEAIFVIALQLGHAVNGETSLNGSLILDEIVNRSIFLLMIPFFGGIVLSALASKTHQQSVTFSCREMVAGNKL